MELFEAVKSGVTVPAAAERYGIEVNRYGMAACPFHNDGRPSLKLNEDYFYCFGCGAHGDVIDLVSGLFNLSAESAARRLAENFGISWDGREGARSERRKPPPAPPPRPALTPEQKSRRDEADARHMFTVLTEYSAKLRRWKKDFEPQTVEDINPLYVEAMVELPRVEYVLDELLDGSRAERAAIVAEQLGTVKQLEARLKEEKPRVRDTLNAAAELAKGRNPRNTSRGLSPDR